MKNCSIQCLQETFSGNHWPHFLALESMEQGYQLTLDINNNIAWLEGHFPKQPILAGVVQTHWAATLSKFIFDLNSDFQQIDNLKFQEVILPEQTIRLSLEFNAEKNSVKFSYSNSGSNHFSEGKILFAKDNTE